MTNFVLTGMEAQAHALFVANISSVDHQLIANIFRSMYTAALPVSQIEAIGSAMVGFTVSLQPALTELVRAKVLRSRMICGVRHYELNFPEAN